MLVVDILGPADAANKIFPVFALKDRMLKELSKSGVELVLFIYCGFIFEKNKGQLQQKYVGAGNEGMRKRFIQKKGSG